MSFEDVGIAQERQDDTDDAGDGEIDRWQDALAAIAETAAPRDDCPEPERIWDAAHGELTPDDLREVVDHTATCAVCAEAWQLAEELQAEKTEVDPKVPANDDGSFWGNWMRIAAMVVLLAGAAYVFRDPSPSIERSGDPYEITALTPDTQALSRESLVLRWTPVPADDGPRVTYDVEVIWERSDTAISLLRQGRLTRPELAIPPEQLERLPEGEQTLLWIVRVRRGDDIVVRKSFTVRVR